MSSLPGALVALLLIWGIGFGATVWLLRRAPSIEFWECAALSWFLGTAIFSLSLWCLSFFLRGVGLQIGVTFAALAIAIWGSAEIRARRHQIHCALPKSRIEVILATVLCVELAVVIYLSLKNMLGWDGLLIWELKARCAYLNGGALPTAYFADASRRFSHPEYPLFLPLNETWLYLWMGECNQYWVKLLFPIFYGAGIILIARAAIDLTGKRWIGLLVATLFIFVPSIHGGAGSALTGYVDVPLGLFYLGTLHYLFTFIRKNSNAALGFFITLNSALPWIKREGVILWAVAGCCGGYAIWKRRGFAHALASFIPGVCVSLGFRLYLHYVHASSPVDFVPVSFHALCSHLGRSATILRELFYEASRMDHWSVFWFITVLGLFCLLARNRVRYAGMLFMFMAVPLVLYCSTYFFSAWPDYIEHIESSLPRLLVQLYPTAWLVIAAAIAPRDRAV